MSDDGILKERGAERSGYRGCLIGGLLFGAIGAFVTVTMFGTNAAKATPEMPAFLFQVMYGSVGFVIGAIIGNVVIFLLDLVTRKKEREIDQF